MNPGSDEAIAAGCQCPVLDNARGKGIPGSDGAFWIDSDCPLHGAVPRALARAVGIETGA